MKNFFKKEHRTPIYLPLIFLLFTIGIITAGVLYYQNTENSFRTEVENQLTAIADLKVSQIVQWRKERLVDGKIFYKNDVFADLIKRYFKDQNDLDAKKRILAWMNQVYISANYDAVLLSDTTHSKRIIVSEKSERPKVFISSDIFDSLKSGKIVFEDFYRDEVIQKVFLKVLVPIVDEMNSNQLIAIVELRIDPETYLYPLINSWPTPSKTSETLIAKREGDSAVFLNELKFQKNTPLNFHIPLNRKDILVVKAVLGEKGVTEGLDYKGDEVMGYICSVPNSPWFMVARMDKAEMFAPLKEKLWTMLVFITVLIFAIGAGLGFFWRHQRVKIYKEKAEAAELLRETNEYLENLINYANAPIIVWDANGNITQFNRAFEELSGLKAEKVLGNGHEILFADEDRESSMSIVNRAGSGERFELVEVPILQTNGNKRIVLWNSAPIYGLDGTTQIATIAQGLDITERKQADENLQVSEERFRRAVVDSPYPILIHAEDGAIIQASNSWCEITGYSRDELKTINDWTERAYGEKKAMVQEDIDRLYGLEHRIAEGDYKVRTKNGESRIWEFSSAPLGKLPDGRRMVISMAMDVTDRRLADEEIRKLNAELEQRVVERTAQLVKSENLLSETGRLARVGGWEIDLITGKNVWSETTYKIHEVEADFDPNLDTAIHFYSPESLPIISECVDSLIKFGEPFDKELTLITAKKNKIWVRAIGQAYLENDKIVKIGGTFQDINERKLAEQERELLLQKIQNNSVLLESANKELEAFSYSVSHDLRSPLRAIEGFSRFLFDDYYDKLDDEGKRLLSIIKDNTRKMDQLISDLLALSRVTRSELKYSRIDMTALAKSMYNEIASDDVKEMYEFNVLDLPDAFGDGNIMRQVWINLISNAIKFSMKSKVRKIEIGSNNTKGNNIYYVKDQGVGFDAKYKHKLFGVFQRLHSSEEFEGTGVGLAIAQRIVHRHGGEIWADGEIDKGATFYFTIERKSKNILNK